MAATCLALSLPTSRVIRQFGKVYNSVHLTSAVFLYIYFCMCPGALCIASNS